jgi:hypothetical protein
MVQRIVEKYSPQLQIYREAWQECTGEPVTETGIYLVQLNKYVVVERKILSPTGTSGQ